MKQVDGDDLINWWLEKYHNTNLDKVREDHPEWELAEKNYDEMKNNHDGFSEEERSSICEEMGKATREFYVTYSVTQEQHDEWQKWAKEYTKKITKIPMKLLNRSWWSVYLNCSPSVIENE